MALLALRVRFDPGMLQFKNACVVKSDKFWSRLLSRNWTVVCKWVPGWDEKIMEGGIKLASKSELMGDGAP